MLDSNPNSIAEKLLDRLVKYFPFRRDVQGDFTFVGDQVERVLGYSAVEFKKSWKDVFTDKMQEYSTAKRFLFALPSTHEETYEVEVRGKSGTMMWLRIVEQACINGDNKPTGSTGLALDWTQYKSQEVQLKYSEQRFREMNSSSPVGVFQIDANDLYIYINPAWEAIAGRSMIETLGTPWWSVIHPDDQERVFKEWAQAEGQDSELTLECRLLRPDGDVRWVQFNTRFLFYDYGKVTMGILQDVTGRNEAQTRQERLIEKLLEMQKQLEEAARTDPLTGLPNRRAMTEKICEEKTRFDRSHKDFSMIIIDIDHFKKINDTYGHDAGDQVLVGIARLMRNMWRKQDMICRWGGEEFLALLPETDLKGAMILAEKMRSGIEAEPFLFGAHCIRVTLSLGVNVFDEKNQKDTDECISQADHALYQAKKSGRNRVVAFVPKK